MTPAAEPVDIVPVDPGLEAIVVVRVEDASEPRLTGRRGGVYQSPPQTREQAIELVRLLVGRHTDPPDSESTWMTAVARRGRTVTPERILTATSSLDATPGRRA